MLKRLFVLLLTLVLIIAALSGCVGGNNIDPNVENMKQQNNDKESKNIVIAFDAEFRSMDPHDTNHDASYSVQSTMMQGLLGFDKDMKIIPVLAESFESNKEATEFTFKLRKGIMFHDNTPFNADAVKVNIDRLANQENRLKRNSLYAMVDKTEVIDEYTVKIILKDPFGAMINTLAHPAAMMHSPAALLKYGKEVSRNPVGTGPFKFKEWIPGDHVTVVKNEDYWKEGYPKVDSIIFKSITENSTRIAMLQTGEADFIFPVPTEQVAVINKNKESSIEILPSIGIRHITINCMKKPFDDIRVRKAMNYATDKEAYINVVHNGFAKEMDSVIAPGTQFYAKQEPYEYNIEMAKKLLKEAGYEEGFKADVWASNESDNVRGMEFIQQQMSKINIDLTIFPMESGMKNERLWEIQRPEDAEVQLHYATWSPSTGDADWGIRPLFATDSFPPNSYNNAYYSNPEVDHLLEEALKTADQNVRKEAYRRVQEIIWDDVPSIFLIVEESIVGRRSNVKGIYVMPDGIVNMHDAEIE